MPGTPDLVLEDMLTLLRKRTKVTNDDGWLIRELNDAQAWAWERLYLTNPDIQLTFGTTSSLAADAQTLDLTTAIAATIWGIKRMWIKGSQDTDYIPVVFKDENDPLFLSSELITPAQVIHPVLAAVYNFNQIRFGNLLPSGTSWKVDWIGTPPLLSLDTNARNTSVPAPLNYPTLARAQAVIYDSIDDTRAGEWFAIALERLSTASKNLKRRQFLNKSKTQSYPRRVGGFSRPY